MARVRNENKGNEIIPRNLIFDERLSDRARFVYCYMSAKPDDWDFVLAPMAKELGYSVDTLRKYLNELISNGWITKGEQRHDEVTNKFGCNEYTINNKPVRVGEPYRKKPDTEKTRDGKIPTQQYNSTINSPINDNSTINSPVKEKGKSTRARKVKLSKEEEEFIEKMKKKFPRIMKMDQPLTLEQAKKLKGKYDQELLFKEMSELENWKPLLQKRVNAYRTIITWCDKEQERL